MMCREKVQPWIDYGLVLRPFDSATKLVSGDGVPSYVSSAWKTERLLMHEPTTYRYICNPWNRTEFYGPRNELMFILGH